MEAPQHSTPPPHAAPNEVRAAHTVRIETADRMRELGYLDDEAFAERCVESRQAGRPRSERMLRQELAQKGIDRDTIERTMMVRDPDATARREWEAAGATRLIVAPWERTSGALRGLERFANDVGLASRPAAKLS